MYAPILNNAVHIPARWLFIITTIMFRDLWGKTYVLDIKFKLSFLDLRVLKYSNLA